MRDRFSKSAEKLRKLPWLSILMLAIFVLPAFFTFPKAPQRQIIRVQPKTVYYSVIPERAVALTDIRSYQDASLTTPLATIKKQTQLSIKTLVTSEKKTFFELANGSFVVASPKSIGSDVTLTSKNVDLLIFTTQTVNVLYNPFTTFDSQVYTTLPANQTLSALKEAQTHWGTYYEVSFSGGRTGWVSGSSISLQDPRMLVLQKELQQKYGSTNFSITVKELDSKFTVSVNPNEEMYAASLWKLPILYWVQKQLNNGSASLTDQLKYIPAVNDESWGAFNPAGTGELPKTPNNQDYSLLSVINLTAKDSDNVGSNLLAYYETNKFSSSFRWAIDNVAGKTWDPTARNASSLMVSNVLAALYAEGGACYNALIGTDYDNTGIAAGVPKNIVVAHKVGMADGYNHDAAIVFAAKPYILVIETQGGQSDETLSQISQLVYDTLG